MRWRGLVQFSSISFISSPFFFFFSPSSNPETQNSKFSHNQIGPLKRSIFQKFNWISLPPRGGGVQGPNRKRGEREESIGDEKTDSTYVNQNKWSLVNPSLPQTSDPSERQESSFRILLVLGSNKSIHTPVRKNHEQACAGTIRRVCSTWEAKPFEEQHGSSSCWRTTLCPAGSIAAGWFITGPCACMCLMVFVCMCVCVHVCVVLCAACVSVVVYASVRACVNVFVYTLFAPDDWAIRRVCSTSNSSIKINTTRNITVVAAAESDLFSQAWMSKDWIHRGVAGWDQMKLESDIHWQVCWLCLDSACFVYVYMHADLQSKHLIEQTITRVR